jgi:hypothetical protein
VNNFPLAYYRCYMLWEYGISNTYGVCTLKNCRWICWHLMLRGFFNKIMCFLVLYWNIFLPLYIHIYSENCTCKYLLIETWCHGSYVVHYKTFLKKSWDIKLLRFILDSCIGLKDEHSLVVYWKCLSNKKHFFILNFWHFRLGSLLVIFNTVLIFNICNILSSIFCIWNSMPTVICIDGSCMWNYKIVFQGVWFCVKNLILKMWIFICSGSHM